MSENTYDVALLILVTLMYVAICAEADMYVPAFPQMIDAFKVADNQIQLILSLNFGGLCVASLIAGPLSDSFGRRKVLLGGLFLFLISSIGCVQTSNFGFMLFWRLLQGLAASFPMVVGVATFLDKYSAEKAGQLIGFINSVISGSMAGAPIVGAWVSQHFSWRANFVVILIMAVILFLGTFLFIEETLPQSKRRKFNFLNIAKDYLKLTKSLKFIAYTLIVNFPFTAIVVYIANLSVIFINHMQMTLAQVSYYQATTMGTFIVFSLLSVKIIGKKGLDYTKNLGGTLALIGAIGMFYVSQFDPLSVNSICLSMAFIAAGGALMAGTFGLKSLTVFPDMSGTSMAMSNSIRQLLACALVLLSEFLFDGTIIPVALIIFGYGMVALGAYLLVCYRISREKIAW